ncbi:MAG: YdcF family protein [Clostridiales bacterium]|nr:YdcF family protein [Clostridiales bacterium]
MHQNLLQIIIRLILGIGASVLIIGFVTLLLNGASKNLGALIGIVFMTPVLLYAIFMPKIHEKIGSTWKAGGAGKRALITILVLIVVGILVIITETVFMCIYAHRKAPASEHPPVVLVLGCQVRNGSPSTLLRTRIDTAYEYLAAHPESPCIVSGGQGSDEAFSEAKCMFDELVKMGIDPERIYIEDKSTTTRQNLRFSKEIMEKEDLGDTILIVTNSWHELRAQMIAKDLGIPCGGLGAETPWWLLPANYMREIMAILYQIVF